MTEESATMSPAQPGGFATVVVVGAGTMGHGIAQVSAQAGAGVTLVDIADDAVQRGLDTLFGAVGKLLGF